MIYELEEHLFDITKLETISKIYYKQVDSYTCRYYFDYQINGFKYTFEDYHEITIEKIREKLLNTWKIELYYESIG